MSATLFASLLLAPALAHATPPLDLPWDCGVRHSITQGHNTGSHTGKGAWAWDMSLAEGEDIVAVADGVIRRVKNDSSRYGCDSAYANDGNYVVLDFEDGTEALYLHLQKGSIPVQVGDRVTRGQRLGKIGKSGWICGVVNEGVHLHFQIQSTCSSWYCQSFQANFDMIGDPGYGEQLESDNCAEPIDCTISATEGKVIDDRDQCFRRVTQWWWDEAGGWGDGWQYTYATDSGEADTQGWWRFETVAADDYDIEVHIPPGAQSRQAKYNVHLSGQAYGPFTVDQTAQTGWVKLGTFNIGAGVEGDVHLPDNTGEPYSEQGKRRLAYDAVRVVPAEDVVTMPEEDMGAMMDPTPEVDMGTTPEPMPEVDMGSTFEPMPEVDMGAEPVAPGQQDMSGDVDAVDMGAGAGEDGGYEIVGEGTCASAPRSPSSGGAGLALLALLGVGGSRRRRRR